MATPQPNPRKRPLTTGIVGRICYVSPRTVSKWIDTGELRGWRVPSPSNTGGDRRIDPSDFLAFLGRHGMEWGRQRLARYLSGDDIDTDGPCEVPIERAEQEPEPPADPSVMGSIYFIRFEEDGPIKIGFSMQPERRIAALQTGAPRPLDRLGLIFGTKGKEVEIHRSFASSRVVGEWFRPTPELLAFIAGNAMAWSCAIASDE